ncbi:uncharacterized protein BXZ73DRAFT_88035 [Epithele typhae]|uniref:uncharacterized protein n=1 Tax=Epithele typhae TaxID=378194 RepID=UPI002007AAAF|nr:uncharacterized protein BXZ73DRAFT_88035 [Epithele typhae]KAH9942464.1 hypothetical protein BXZ73DRAFT_88035 [Epithele typhae]
MPTCLAPSSGLLRPSAHPHSLILTEERKAQVLTALHKTTSLIPRILSNQKPTPGVVAPRESLAFWQDVLSGVYEVLTLSSEQRAKDVVRIAVYGMDELSGAGELVTALLEDPFASDEQKRILRSRWEIRCVSFAAFVFVFTYSRYGTSESSAEDVIALESPWLRQFGVPVEIAEFKTSKLSQLVSGQEVSKAIYTADVVVVLATLCPPLCLPFLPPHPHSLYLVKAPSSLSPQLFPSINSNIGSSIIASLALQPALHVVFVDPTRAVQGLDAFSSGLASASSVERYQDNSPVQDILSSSTTTVEVHIQTGRALILDASMNTLRVQMEEAKAKVHLEVFGNEQKGADEIVKALAHAKSSVKATMDALQWYKLSGASTMSRGRHRGRRPGMLVFHAGRLAALQTSFTDAATALCRTFPPSSAYHSPVLLNALARLSSAPAFPLPPSTLTAPLHARQAQLAHPTARLHAAAQRAVLTLAGSTLGGLGVAWAGWASELRVLDVGLGAETALGAGMLGAALGVRWAVGAWERAKRRWWRDWGRVGEGLERDLRVALIQTMEQRVTSVSDAACLGLEGMVVKRKAEVGELKEEIEALGQTIQAASR